MLKLGLQIDQQIQSGHLRQIVDGVVGEHFIIETQIVEFGKARASARLCAI